MATILYPDGRTEEVQPQNGTDFQLGELQAFVGGHIEVVPIRGDPRRILVVNEEGRLLGLPRNEQATRVAGLPSREERYRNKLVMEELGYRVIDVMLGEEDYIAGVALLCLSEEVQ
jgi:hypothetical protein